MPGKSAVAEMVQKGYTVKMFGRDSAQWQAFNIRRNPTFVFVRHGREVSRMTGSKSANQLESMWRRYTLFE